MFLRDIEFVVRNIAESFIKIRMLFIMGWIYLQYYFKVKNF